MAAYAAAVRLMVYTKPGILIWGNMSGFLYKFFETNADHFYCLRNISALCFGQIISIFYGGDENHA